MKKTLEIINRMQAEKIIETYATVKTRVLRVEHLIAIMLQTDRPKDRTRITQALEEAEVDMANLSKNFEKHGLSNKWQTFQRRYYGR